MGNDLEKAEGEKLNMIKTHYIEFLKYEQYYF